MRKIFYRIIAICLLCLFAFSGCGILNSEKQTANPAENQTAGYAGDSTDNTSGTERDSDMKSKENAKVELDERQKQILREAGLSENYDELEPHQQSAIKAIDELLAYMEDKYDKTFCYEGYAPSDVLEDEKLYCYEEGTLPEQKITVTRTYDGNEYTISDDYDILKAGEKYSAELSDVLAEILPEKDYVAAAEVTRLPKEEGEDLISSASALSLIFLSPEKSEEDDFRKISEQVFERLSGKFSGTPGEVLIYGMNKEAFDSLTPFDYDEVLNEYGFERMCILKYKKDGTSSIEFR